MFERMRFCFALAACLVAAMMVDAQFPNCKRKCRNLTTNEAYYVPNNTACYSYSDVYGDDMYSTNPSGGGLVCPKARPTVTQTKWSDCVNICYQADGETEAIGPRIQTKGMTATGTQTVDQQYCVDSAGNIIGGGGIGVGPP